MKRSESFYSFGSKKPKLQQDVDDIWGDDPEIEEVDRCINMATQICSQKTQLPTNTINQTSYDIFKRNQNIYASTQAFLPSTSGIRANNSSLTLQSTSTVVTKNGSDEEFKLHQKIQSLESEKEKLTEMYKTKSGEITLLRTKLKQVEKAVESEKMEKLRFAQENQQKWDSKINNAHKEVNTLKCELELKNLEIVNLRDKLFELKKVYNSNLNMTILNDELSQVVIPRNKTNKVSEHKVPKVNKNIQTEISDYSYPATSITNYPLQNLIPKSVFEKCQEKNHSLKIKNINKNLSSYKPNFTTSTKAQENIFICFNNLHPDIHKLIRCTEEELNNSVDVANFIQNILNLNINNLLWLLNQLKTINEELSYDDVEHMNNFYLEQNEIQYQSDCIFSGIAWHEDETSVDVRRYLAILSSLVFHCKKLCNHFTSHSIENQMEIDGEREFEFLNMVLEIVTIIKNIRRSEQFCGFQSVVLALLGNLSCSDSLPLESYQIIFYIFKQIIFSRPSKPVLKYACEFLKHLCHHNIFVVKLCTLKKCEGTQSSVKDGLLFVSEDSCAFRILSTELETCNMSTEMASNVIKFLLYSVSCNVYWIYHQEEQRCQCLVGVYSLGINVLFNTLQENSEGSEDKTKIHLHHSIFQMGLMFLNILTTRIPDLVLKCSRLLSQYQTIIKYISGIQQKLHLEKTHETALENLMSQLNSDAQKQSQNKSIDSSFNNLFASI